MPRQKSSKRKRMENKVYGTYRWRKLRKEILQPGTPCSICGMVLAWEVHHIVTPFNSAAGIVDETLAFAKSNLQPTCGPCHREKHIVKRRCTYCGKLLNKGQCDWCIAMGYEGGI